MARIFNEPHSTNAYEDGVRYAWASSGEVIDWCYRGWHDIDMREQARSVSCPTLVIHGDQDKQVLYARGHGSARTGAGRQAADHRRRRPCAGGHVPAARDPVVFNRADRNADDIEHIARSTADSP